MIMVPLTYVVPLILIFAFSIAIGFKVLHMRKRRKAKAAAAGIGEKNTPKVNKNVLLMQCTRSNFFLGINVTGIFSKFCFSSTFLGGEMHQKRLR